MTETKSFHIGDVLSAATGILVSPRHVDGVYDILNWMTGDNLFTHQLPRASRECEPYLREWFPALTSVEIPDTINSRETADAFLESLYPEFGEYVEVGKVSTEDHTKIGPISELRMHFPDKPIIVVGSQSEETP